MTLLKEFELRLPTDNERKRQFQLQTRCVTALYERLFPRFQTGNCWKVLVECVDTIAREQYRDLLGVYALEVEADVERFFSLSDVHKKEWALEVLQDGITRLLEQTGWSAQPFLDAYRKARDLQLVNHWVWKKPAWSPSRKAVAEVLVEHEVQFCNISIVVRDKDRQEIARKPLISEQPDEWAYADHLGSLEWVSETRVLLRNKKGDRTWHLDL